MKNVPGNNFQMDGKWLTCAFWFFLGFVAVCWGFFNVTGDFMKEETARTEMLL